jgi:hypothetical protein
MIQRLGILLTCLALGIALLIDMGYSEIGKGIAILSFIMGLTMSLVYIFGSKYKITYNHWGGGFVKFECPKWKRWLLLGCYPSLDQIEARAAYRYGGEEAYYGAYDNIIWHDTGEFTTCVDRPCTKRLYFGFQEQSSPDPRLFVGKGAILLEILLQRTGEKLASFNIEVSDFRFWDEIRPPKLKYKAVKKFISD